MQPARASEAAFEVYGYHPWWMGDLWTTYDFDRLDGLMLFELRADTTGRLAETHGWPEQWHDLTRKARKEGAAVIPTITLFGAQEFVALFASEAATLRLLDAITETVTTSRADGVHLDVELFEPVPAAARDGFTSFVHRLRARLDAYRKGVHLSLFMPAFDHGEAFDEAALAPVADAFVVQGYDLHWVTGPTAGPVAPLRGWNGANWEAIVDRYLALGVPRRKLVMAIPYFGYEWPTESEAPGAPTRGEAEIITYAPVDPERLPDIRINAEERGAAYGLRRDPVSGSPYYAYEGEDGWYQGWFEDAESLRAKYEFIRAKRLGGIAIFPLGYDGGKLFALVP